MDGQSEVFASQETLSACYRRIGVISLIVLLVFCALGFRLWQLQIVEGDRFRTLSEKKPYSPEAAAVHTGPHA